LPARALLTALFVQIFVFSVTNVSAQDDLAGDSPEVTAVETQNPVETPDPIKINEQSLVIGGADTAAIPASSGVSIFSIFRVLLTLAVVAAAIYGLVYFLKFRRGSRAGSEQDPFLKILSSAPLGASRGVHVVSVGQQAWLVGSAETGVNLISEISDKDIINAMLLEDSKRMAASPAGAKGMLGARPMLDFKAILDKLGFSAKTENSGPEQIRKRSERLKGL
jgi:flagellar protein FliO/FliZ